MAADAQAMIADFQYMTIPSTTGGRNTARSGDAAECAESRCVTEKGNRARGGRWGSSGMCRVLSSDTRGTTAWGATGDSGITEAVTPENAWWQQEWPEELSCES